MVIKRRRGVTILIKLGLMILKNFRFLLANGEDGTKMEKKNILSNSIKKGKMMAFLLIGTKMELRLESGIIKMDKKMVYLKHGMMMEKSRKKRYLEKGKKMGLLASGIKMENLNWIQLLKMD